MKSMFSITRGQNIFVAVKQICLDADLNVKNLRGISTDGAPAMVGFNKGLL